MFQLGVKLKGEEKQPVKKPKDKLKNFASRIQTTERKPSVWFRWNIFLLM